MAVIILPVKLAEEAFWDCFLFFHLQFEVMHTSLFSQAIFIYPKQKTPATHLWNEHRDLITDLSITSITLNRECFC